MNSKKNWDLLDLRRTDLGRYFVPDELAGRIFCYFSINYKSTSLDFDQKRGRLNYLFKYVR